MADEPMTSDERETLAALSARPRTIVALMDYLGLSGTFDEVSALAASIEGLSKRGYVDRVPVQTKGRFVTYRATSAGQFASQREAALDEILGRGRHREVVINGVRYAVDLVALDAPAPDDICQGCGHAFPHPIEEADGLPRCDATDASGVRCGCPEAPAARQPAPETGRCPECGGHGTVMDPETQESWGCESCAARQSAPEAGLREVGEAILRGREDWPDDAEVTAPIGLIRAALAAHAPDDANLLAAAHLASKGHDCEFARQYLAALAPEAAAHDGEEHCCNDPSHMSAEYRAAIEGRIHG